jgi:FkbM family methyltransferase
MPSLLHRLSHRPVDVGAIVSLGAGRGDDSAHLLNYWPQAKLLLIEMDERFQGEFQALSQANPKISYEVCAAAAEDRDGYFTKTDAFGGAIAQESTEGAKPIKFRKVDTLVQAHGMTGPYFLKFDTHGAELDILAGAQQVLAQTSLILMEVYNFKLKFMDFKNLTFDEMSIHMKSLGFRCIDLCDPLYRPGDRALWQMHMLFARDDHPSFALTGYNSAKRPA